MQSSNASAEALAEAILLQGRNAVAQPDQALGRALEGTVQPAALGEGGTTVSVSLCRSASELSRTLSQGTSLNLGAGPLPLPLPLPLLSARQQFLQSLRTTVFSVSLVVQARHVVSAVEVPDPQLLNGIALPGDSAALEAFVARFGDSYVSALKLGGEVQGVYTFYAQTREEARQVEQSFGGALAVAGFTLGPELSRRAEQVARSTAVNSSFKVAVLGLRQPPVLTPESLADFASGFGAMPLDQPEPLELATRGYETVEQLRVVFAPVTANREIFTGDAFGGGLLRREQRLREVQHQCDWVAGTCALYGIAAEPSLAEQQQQLQADLGTLRDLKRGYVRSPSTALTEPELPSLTRGSPRLNVAVVDGEAMGGSGGEPFTFADRATAVQSRKRLLGVGLRAGARIVRIRLSYERDSDAFTPAQPVPEEYGGEHGSDLGDLQLAPGVSLAAIDARTGVPNGRVDRLSLTTSDGQSIGGGGDAGNQELHWQRGPDEVVLGFSGRAASELDALRAVIARFGPLRWEPVPEAEDP